MLIWIQVIESRLYEPSKMDNLLCDKSFCVSSQRLYTGSLGRVTLEKSGRSGSAFNRKDVKRCWEVKCAATIV